MNKLQYNKTCMSDHPFITFIPHWYNNRKVCGINLKFPKNPQ